MKVIQILNYIKFLLQKNELNVCELNVYIIILVRRIIQISLKLQITLLMVNKLLYKLAQVTVI